MTQTFRTIEAILRAVPRGEREGVLTALGSERSAEAVAQVLWDHGHTISPSTIRTYRRMKRQTQETE